MAPDGSRWLQGSDLVSSISSLTSAPGPAQYVAINLNNSLAHLWRCCSPPGLGAAQQSRPTPCGPPSYQNGPNLFVLLTPSSAIWPQTFIRRLSTLSTSAQVQDCKKGEASLGLAHGCRKTKPRTSLYSSDTSRSCESVKSDVRLPKPRCWLLFRLLLSSPPAEACKL